ncbi:hypothetical protein [Dyella sp. GSA-30]|uniref:hypothetical protein n=1 Tax=Dyella sp. GSA-30 TaxID=2994496 RepID=UPI002492E8E2|nr:hypothetical protein [Dyella sp. GSA-30]BDU20403.1 hypothetical protein DYGSA30_18600 [Dyella sp. GSA-30]
MSKLSLVSFALAAVLSAGAAYAQAADPAVQAPSTDKQVVKPGDRNCIRDTGSLIKAKQGKCLPVAGRSYGQEDIRQTGETQLGPALQKLDPSITVRGR